LPRALGSAKRQNPSMVRNGYMNTFTKVDLHGLRHYWSAVTEADLIR